MRAGVRRAASFYKRRGYDIAEKVSARRRRVAATASTDLDCSRANLARRVETSNAYVANVHSHCLHAALLICDSCGHTSIATTTASKGRRAAAQATGSRPTGR